MFPLNRLTKKEVNDLAVGLKNAKSLEQIFLDRIRFTQKDYLNLVSVFRSKTSLQLMNFGDFCDLSAKVVAVNLMPTKNFTRN